MICLRVLVAVAVAFAIAPARGEGDEEKKNEPAVGLNVGELVPISAMHVAYGERPDSTTCLAGKNRGRRTVSVYAASIDEPGLGDLMKSIDRQIGTDETRAAYLLLLAGQNDSILKERIKVWAKELGLKQTEVAISNSVANGNARRFGLAETAAVTVVCSDKRHVTFRTEFEKGKLDEAALASLEESLTAQLKK